MAVPLSFAVAAYYARLVYGSVILRRQAKGPRRGRYQL